MTKTQQRLIEARAKAQRCIESGNPGAMIVLRAVDFMALARQARGVPYSGVGAFYTDHDDARIDATTPEQDGNRD